jgi:hypothetical protein
MANFFDPLSEEPVYAFRIPQTGTFTIGLWEGGPVGPQSHGGSGKLDVTSSYVASFSQQTAVPPDSALVRDKDIGFNRRLLTFRVDRLKGSYLYALYYGAQYIPPIHLQRVDVRKSIVDLARSFVALDLDGRKCHYLWGTAGNTPGRSDGNPGGGKVASAQLRAANLDVPAPADVPPTAKNPDRTKVLGIRIATTQIDGHNTCAGRSSKYVNSLSKQDFDNYVKMANALATRKGGVPRVLPTEWPGMGPDELHPRIYYWKGDKQESGIPVWGEACDGVPHFDCIGLVNYCYAFHYYVPNFGVDIAVWARPLDANGIGKEITDQNDVMNADVVIRKDATTGGLSHIAMVYLDGDKRKIVQAEGTAIGLNDDSDYKPTDWWKRVRVADSYLVVKKAHL